VNKEDYEAVLPESFRNLVGKYHFTWAISHLLSFLRVQRQARHLACSGFEYVFDWMNEGSEERNEVGTAMARAEEVAIEDGTPGEFTNYSFRCRKDIPGLQLVDCASWVAYCFAMFTLHKRPMHELAEVGWQDFGGPLAEEGWLGAVTVKRKHLQKWYNQVLAQPDKLEQYKRVEQKRLDRVRGLLACDTSPSGPTHQIVDSEEGQRDANGLAKPSADVTTSEHRSHPR
jgi:hypothetical protein